MSDYYPDETEYEIGVSPDGYIDGESKAELSLTNWILRVSIGVVDSVMQKQVSDVNLALYDSSDNLLRSWTSSGNSMEITNIDAGDYYIVVNGDTEKKYDLTVVNSREVQSLNIRILTTTGIVVLAGIVLFLILVLVILILVIRRKRKKKKAEEASV